MPIVNKQYLITPKPSQVIWRYIDLEKFESLLENRAMFFCRLDNFNDDLEGTLPIREIEHLDETVKIKARTLRQEMSCEKVKEDVRIIIERHEKARRATIVSCWNMDNEESYDLWNQFLNGKDGVAIQTTVGSLYDAHSDFAEEILISEVRYIYLENDIWFHQEDYPVRSLNLLSPIIHKNKNFTTEKELRLFQIFDEAMHNSKYWDDKVCKKGKLIPCNLGSLIQKIIIPNKSYEYIFATVDNLLKKYGLNLMIERSRTKY